MLLLKLNLGKLMTGLEILFIQLKSTFFQNKSFFFQPTSTFFGVKVIFFLLFPKLLYLILFTVVALYFISLNTHISKQINKDKLIIELKQHCLDLNAKFCISFLFFVSLNSALSET